MTKPIDLIDKEHSRLKLKRVCTWCGDSVTEFKDKISEKEHAISGFCQKCQDATFDEEEDLEKCLSLSTLNVLYATPITQVVCLVI